MCPVLSALQCLQQYVQLAITEGGGAPITCPDPVCRHTGALLDSEVPAGVCRSRVKNRVDAPTQTVFTENFHGTLLEFPVCRKTMNAAKGPGCALWLQIASLAPADQAKLYQRLKFERGRSHSFAHSQV